MIQPASQGPHPLAIDLAEALQGRNARVLVLGTGDGRNLPALHAAGADVVALPSSAAVPSSGVFDAVLSTHALLHGTRPSVALRLEAIHQRLAGGALLYATFGSTTDPRYATGVPVDDGAGWAPTGGPEAGVAHAYFDEPTLREALASYEILLLEARDARGSVGRWAHEPSPEPIVHWFVKARRG